MGGTFTRHEKYLCNRLRVRGVQLFCRKGIKEFEKTVASVKGVKKVEARNGAKTIQVTGDEFDCNAVLKAFREAGIAATYS